MYIICSRTRVLYCGVANSVARRTGEHQSALIPGFTAQYRCHRLVWFEHYKYVYAALEREKQIKGWNRAKKIAIIEQMNPSWSDLSEAWHAATADPSTTLRSRRDDKGRAVTFRKNSDSDGQS